MPTHPHIPSFCYGTGVGGVAKVGGLYLDFCMIGCSFSKNYVSAHAVCIYTIILSNLYSRISRVVEAKYCTSAVGMSVMHCLDNE